MLTKSKLNSIKVLISKALIDSNFNHDEFVLINNVLKEYKRYERYKRRNRKFNDSNSLWKILVYS